MAIWWCRRVSFSRWATTATIRTTAGFGGWSRAKTSSAHRGSSIGRSRPPPKIGILAALGSITWSTWPPTSSAKHVGPGPLSSFAHIRSNRSFVAARYNGGAYEDDTRLSLRPHAGPRRYAGRIAWTDSPACLDSDAARRVPPACRRSDRGAARRGRSAPGGRLPCRRHRRAHRLAVEGIRSGLSFASPQRDRTGVKRTVPSRRASRGLRTGGDGTRHTHPIANPGRLILRRPDAVATPASGNREPDAR